MAELDPEQLRKLAGKMLSDWPALADRKAVHAAILTLLDRLAEFKAANKEFDDACYEMARHAPQTDGAVRLCDAIAGLALRTADAEAENAELQKRLGDAVAATVGPAAARTRAGWQPIATAPRDGTTIIGRHADRIRLTFWSDQPPLCGWNCGSDTEGMELWQPTRWKRLVAKPC